MDDARLAELQAMRNRAAGMANLIHNETKAQMPSESGIPVNPIGEIRFWLEIERLARDTAVQTVRAAGDYGAKWWEIGVVMGRTAEAARAWYTYNTKEKQ